jgi:hypothetical protein
VFLILPAADTECFQIFLNTLAKKHSRSHILLIVDGAGNHNKLVRDGAYRSVPPDGG